MQTEKRQVKMIVLCMDDHKSNLFAIKELKTADYQGKIAATARHDDDLRDLKKLGVDSVYNLYTEAGTGLADHICSNTTNDPEKHKSLI